jgi:F-type H+-transporting ATPase subunit b
MRTIVTALAATARLAVPLLGLALVASPALAAEAGEEPSLLAVDIPTVVTAIVTFVVLLIVLAKTAWKPILQGLQKREDTIRKALDEAAAASERAKALVLEYEQKIAHARDEARAIAEEAKRDADTVKRSIEETAQRTAEETRERAQREIAQARDKAYEEILRDVAFIATEAAGRIVRERLDAAAHTRLVDEVVAEFRTDRKRAAGSRT